MEFSEFAKAFAEALRAHIHPRKITVMTENWDPTYGHGDPRPEEIELFSLEELCDAMDNFGDLLRVRGK